MADADTRNVSVFAHGRGGKVCSRSSAEAGICRVHHIATKLLLCLESFILVRRKLIPHRLRACLAAGLFCWNYRVALNLLTGNPQRLVDELIALQRGQ